jgi:lipoteichoic acid synthase
MKNNIFKILNFLKNFIINNIDIIYTISIITYKAINYDKTISPVYFSYNLIFIPVFVAVIAISSISLLFKNKGRIRFLYTFNIVMSIILIADSAYYRYFKDIISISVIRDGVMLGGVKSSLKDVLYPSDFLYLADCVILLPLIRIYRKHINRPQLKFVQRFACFLILFVIGGAWDAERIHQFSLEQPGLVSTLYSRLYVDEYLGDVNFHVLDSYNAVSTKLSNLKSISASKQAEIKQYLEKKDVPEGTTLAGAGKGKNLIVIQVEALQQFVIGAKLNGEEITPNLNKWIGKSMYFNNYYYQVASGNTSDAEFLSLNSLYPAAAGIAYELYPGDTFNSTARQFSDKGYSTVTLNGYQEGFYNRNVMYKAEDFDNFYGEKAYNIDEQVGLGLSDKSFFNQTLEKMKTFKQPYYSFMITLSSHFPYDDQKGYGNTIDLGKYTGSFIGNYINGIHYTDAQLGMFLDKLDKAGILKNSIVVLYGDHYAIPKYQSQGLYDFEGIQKPTDLDWNNLQKVPMMIHFPNDANKGVNSIPSGQVDLYPTIANLFNLNRQYMFGMDLINAKNNIVTFRSGSFVANNTYYASYSDTYYNMSTGNPVKPTTEMKKTKRDTLTELQYNDDILNHNLLKNFIQEDANTKK